MVADVVNTTITGGLISANLLLQDTFSKVLIALFAFVMGALILYIAWNRLKR